ncbi:MAG: phasin [Alphaproteobacteria bacterium HGW-Alphaproteobacteria-16]|nr:MAG: phasin [Alphaproteobacteria bacterium HGW-Alphaproteobacteria-16]
MTSKAPRAGGKKPVAKTPVGAKAATPATPVAAKVEAEKPVAKAAPDTAPAKPAVVAAKPVEAPKPAPAPKAEPVKVEAIVQPAKDVAETVTATVAQVAEPVAEITKDAAPQMAETVAKGTDIMEATIEKSQAMFAEMNERTKAAVEKNTKLVGEMTEFAKGNVEAMVESGKITAKGLEAIGQDAAEYSRKSFESATATLKSMSSVKSPADFFKLQSDFVRQSFDAIVAETSKNTEAMMKLAGDAAQPLSSRFAVAVEKVKTAA